ncbi:hypothetical protein SETIT_4G156900v2 [Setaria italica]|uniref:Uncharacterized protein n=1 Tax=Setaria italica TaxID=4555 RepID=A0A368QUU3_SETIT|nr:hypothetical protein SETIT_4G156900v2 [Setaria italica]
MGENRPALARVGSKTHVLRVETCPTAIPTPYDTCVLAWVYLPQPPHCSRVLFSPPPPPPPSASPLPNLQQGALPSQRLPKFHFPCRTSRRPRCGGPGTARRCRRGPSWRIYSSGLAAVPRCRSSFTRSFLPLFPSVSVSKRKCATGDEARLPRQCRGPSLPGHTRLIKHVKPWPVAMMDVASSPTSMAAQVVFDAMQQTYTTNSTPAYSSGVVLPVFGCQSPRVMPRRCFPLLADKRTLASSFAVPSHFAH